MTHKKETAILLLSLFITLGLIAAGWWWLTQSGKLNLLKSISHTSEDKSKPTSIFKEGTDNLIKTSSSSSFSSRQLSTSYFCSRIISTKTT
jgi:hypothetical protein